MPKKIIFDNCVLSNFALSDSLSVIKCLYVHGAYMTDFVSAENLKGILKGYHQLITIREAVRDGWLQEITLKGKEEKALFESLSVSLGSGEASSIAIAKARRYVFACDDRVARREAALLKVKLTGTIGIIIKATRKKIIDPEKADRTLKNMVARGFHSPVTSVKETL